MRKKLAQQGKFLKMLSITLQNNQQNYTLISVLSFTKVCTDNVIYYLLLYLNIDIHNYNFLSIMFNLLMCLIGLGRFLYNFLYTNHISYFKYSTWLFIGSFNTYKKERSRQAAVKTVQIVKDIGCSKIKKWQRIERDGE